MPVEGELLGDARLRQGLTYYPAVHVKEQVVAVGNVVKIQRLTDAGKPDISFGHLKGVWLWRDKPYIRVQYLAPVLANPPEESIAFKGTPGSGATEVLITSKVADLPLEVLVRSVPIFFSQGELTAQVFQRNVPLSNGPHLQCTRLVDSSLKVAALLDRGFQLLPVAQSFGTEVMHAVCGLEYEEEENSLLGLPRGVGLPGHHDQQSRHLDRSKPSAGTNAPKPTADGRSKPAEAAVAPIDEAKASRALVGRVLLRCSLDGSLLQGGKVVRYPGSVDALRSRVARLYGLWGPSIKISYTRAGDERMQKVPLKCQADLLSLIEASQSLDAPPNAMALTVTGDSRLPCLSYVRAALSVATALASCAFGLLCVWLARVPDDGLPDGVPDDMVTLAWYPYLMYGVALPTWLLLYNCGAALVCMLPEYKRNPALRSHLDATSTGAALLVLAGLLGPDVLLFACDARLSAVEATLSRGAAQGLRRLAVLQHILHGMPLVAASYLLHSGAGAAWEELSFGVLVVSVAALACGLPWLIVEFSQPRNMVPESLEAGVTYYSRRGGVS